MFIDVDEWTADDDSSSNESFNIHSCIRDVKFTRNYEQFIVHRVSSKNMNYSLKKD